jgi:asparagine synthase (glutamine-hydrolysing)
MCGLAGYINFDGKPVEHNRVMLEMLRLQKHRGPDDSGILAINTAGRQIKELETNEAVVSTNQANMVLGFNRLSILDLSENGHQPMLGADGKVALMMNGEVYNAFDFKDDLEAKGYRFRSRTDTEIVLNLYLEYGFDAMIKMLNGMFAIVLLDLRQGSLFLGRDRFGIKPLYVLQTPGRLAFSSEIKSFRALPDFHFELEKDHLDEFLLFRNLIHRTLYKNIVNLTPGEYWHYTFSGDKKETTYYDVSEEGLNLIPAELSAAKLAGSLEQSVNRQLISDVKLGCQLSGGVDSSLVSYYANKHLENGNLASVSVVFDNPRFSEKQYIDYVATELQLKSYQFLMQADYYISSLEEATWHFENPLNHPNTIGIYLLSAEARKHVTVLLSGEGADETMAGYARFSQQNSGLFSKQFIIKLKQNRGALSNFLKYYFNDDLRMLMSSAFSSLNVSQSLMPSFSYTKATTARQDIANSIADAGINKHRKYEIKTFLPDLLMRQDKMSMAHSIENRVPFLDNEFVTTALSLNEQELINYYKGKREEKLILKRLCAGVFSEEFSFRPKMGFGIPLREFMNTSIFKQKFNDLWLPGIKSRGIFKADKVEEWLNNIDGIAPDKLDGLWQMASFEIWALQFIDE